MENNERSLNWFPGHMKKTIDEFKKEIKLIDLIIEIVDARSVLNTSNSEILNVVKANNKKIIKIALKSDLAEINKEDNNIIFTDIKNENLKNIVIKKITNELNDKINTLIKKGYENPKVYIAIVGLPNVGKSSFINTVLGRKHLISKNEPGITRKKNWTKITEYIYMLDTPGVFFKKINNKETHNILALLRTINWNIVDKYDVIKFAYNFYMQNYNKKFSEFYNIENNLSFDDFLKHVCSNKGLLRKNNELDVDAALEKIYNDISNGEICKVNYEK